LAHINQILAKSVKGFSSCERTKNGVFHWLWQSPLQQVSTTMLPVMMIDMMAIQISGNVI